jgi:hypothetical protein
MSVGVTIDADRVNYFRDMIDALCVATGVTLTTKQSWEFARHYALLEAMAAEERGLSPSPALKDATDE